MDPSHDAINKELLELEQQVQLQKRINELRLAEEPAKQKEASNMIVLIVGGQTFACDKSLLTLIPDSMLTTLVAWREESDHPDAPIAIDRDPTVFPLIMTYLRTVGTDFDWNAFAATFTDRERLLLEWERPFFGLPDVFGLPVEDDQILSYHRWSKIGVRTDKRRLQFDSKSSSFMSDKFFTNVTKRSMKLVAVFQLANHFTVCAYTTASWNPSEVFFSMADPSAKLIVFSDAVKDSTDEPFAIYPAREHSATRIYRCTTTCDIKSIAFGHLRNEARQIAFAIDFDAGTRSRSNIDSNLDNQKILGWEIWTLVDKK